MRMPPAEYFPKKLQAKVTDVERLTAELEVAGGEAYRLEQVLGRTVNHAERAKLTPEYESAVQAKEAAAIAVDAATADLASAIRSSEELEATVAERGAEARRAYAEAIEALDAAHTRVALTLGVADWVAKFPARRVVKVFTDGQVGNLGLPWSQVVHELRVDALPPEPAVEEVDDIQPRSGESVVEGAPRRLRPEGPPPAGLLFPLRPGSDAEYEKHGPVNRVEVDLF